MVFNWFSDKFQQVLNRNKTFEKLVGSSFGESKVVFYPIYGSGKEYDIRDSLKIKGASTPMLLGALKEAGVKTSDNNDLKVIKIRDFVNKRLTYGSDNKNYMVAEYWADPYTVYSKKTDDCDGYAVLIMTLMRLAGIPAWRRRVVAGTVFTGEGHAYVVYFTELNNMWCVVEGSYMADLAKQEFNLIPYGVNNRYVNTWFSFNEENSWSKNKEVFKLVPTEVKDAKKSKR